jgi:ATP phosphoribosyltransferase regulatory subunit
MENELYLTSEEKTVLALRGLYESYGYKRFKINKFEEYDLYAENRNFLVNGNVLTFTDTDGRLMALKPDVTMSVIKKTIGSDALEKIYYNENVFRSSAPDRGFTEIMQTGVECIGRLGMYDETEVLSLAAKTLAKVSPDYLLDVSDADFVTGFIKTVIGNPADRENFSEWIVSKNLPAVKNYFKRETAYEKLCAPLCAALSFYGSFDESLKLLAPLAVDETTEKALAELKNLSGVLPLYGITDKVKIDLSIPCDSEYYNGLIFRGFVKGVPEAVLSGGRYDCLAHKIGKRSDAIGFALYHNLLERYSPETQTRSPDVCVLYDGTADPRELVSAVEKNISRGKSVRAVKNGEEADVNSEIIDMRRAK